ncbi:hypothetical protein B0T18DRAFT_235039 [Schizothecium vesticola]|uniref:Uncharacterized protein n=1 Tax=Schizothecium vesticola TaxID=314040 RepID=A0AA40EHA5_9PEZI|nr:hypothetical protein B0T18DRAFT_235039 [Schizothecium vesticola]
MGERRRAWQHRTRIDKGGREAGVWPTTAFGLGLQAGGGGTHNVSSGLGRGGEEKGQTRGGAFCRACTPCHVMSMVFLLVVEVVQASLFCCAAMVPCLCVRDRAGIRSTASGPGATWGDEETDQRSENKKK